MSLVARQKLEETPNQNDKGIDLPEFLAEEGYEMSKKELNENDKKSMQYALNVISKLNRAMHDIYVV